MKRLLIAAAVLMVIAMSANAQRLTTFELKGTAPEGAQQVKIVINENPRQAATVPVDGNRAFSWRGSCRVGDFLAVKDGNGNDVWVVCDSTTATVDLAQTAVQGSALNMAFIQLQQQRRKDLESLYAIAQESRSLQNDNSDAAKARMLQLSAEVQRIDNAFVSHIKQFMREHKNDVLPAWLLPELARQMDYDELATYMDSSTGYYSHPLMEGVRRQFLTLQKRRPGLAYTDLAMSSPDGNTLHLKDFVGQSKYVFVDFWASWCGPCRREMPNVVEAYQKYKDRGLQVVGVSFDQDGDAWRKSIAQLGMTWPQMSDLKGWGCAAHEVYGVNSIPASILIDQKGAIVDVDLRGEKLLKRLQELLGE